MRILDKHYDFYDYLQNIYPDKTITFDRTKSFVLTKDMIKKCLEYTTYNHKIGQTSYILLQVCNRFWLFEAEITDIDQYSCITNFSLTLILNWVNYNLERKLFELNSIQLDNEDFSALWKANTKEREHKIVIDAINRNCYKKKYNLDKIRKWDNDQQAWSVINNIPLLKASGLAELINPLDIYLALEEYFSLERTASERRESIGLTNNEKITNHGFDVKVSFRNIKKK